MKIVGCIGGGLLAGFGVLHSAAGWPALTQELGRYNVPADVVAGLLLPWHFSGFAMVVFGVTAITSNLRRTRPGILAEPLPLGVACALFGGIMAIVAPSVVALAVFSVPGALIAASGVRRGSHRD